MFIVSVGSEVRGLRKSGSIELSPFFLFSFCAWRILFFVANDFVVDVDLYDNVFLGLLWRFFDAETRAFNDLLFEAKNYQ